VIVEPMSRVRADASRAVQVQHHEIGIEYVIDDLEAAGFTITDRQDLFLERPDDERADFDWLLVARRPEPALGERGSSATATRLTDG
jgi:hypothetical protein